MTTEDIKKVEKEAEEDKFCTNIGSMEHQKWPNLVLLRDNYWCVVENIESSCFVGKDIYLEITLSKDFNYQFVKNRYDIGKCLNGSSNLRPRLSVNARNIISVQQFDNNYKE